MFAALRRSFQSEKPVETKPPAGLEHADYSSGEYDIPARAPAGDWFWGGWLQYPDAPFKRGYFNVTGYVIAVDDTLLDGNLTLPFHFVLSSMPIMSESRATFEKNAGGGLNCSVNWRAGEYLRQFHLVGAGEFDRHGIAYEAALFMRQAFECGWRVQVEGLVFDQWVDESSVDPVHDQEIIEYTRFRGFDQVGRCPIVNVWQIEVL